ncbi:MAG: hypothetical protein ABI597_12115 [Gammaproteobacteria bacterium]
MKIIYIFTLMTLIVSTSTQAYSSKLWGNLNYGMSVSDVRKIYPDSKFLNIPEVMGAPTEKNPCRNILKLDSFKVAGYDFESRFCFRENKLIQVLLEIKGKPNADDGLIAVERVQGALLNEYGDPSSEKYNNYGAPMRGYEKLSRCQHRILKWKKSEDLMITLVFMVVTEDLINLNIVYQNSNDIGFRNR